MQKGKLAFVLHAHLPYVRSSEPGSLEEDWFFQALLECYLPLINILQESSSCKDQDPKLTLSLSPTLLSLFDCQELKNRFPSWIKIRLELLKNLPNSHDHIARYSYSFIEEQLIIWENCQGDLISKFASLQKQKTIDLLTCAATHGYLPLLRENPESIIGQLRTASREHTRLIGQAPLGIWLPECAYYEGLDSLMVDAGLRYAVLDGHGLLHATPRPRYGLYAPICSKNGVAFFGRDSKSTLPVWSATQGYPGHPEYREFHRDLGWDLDKDQLKKVGINEPRPLSLKFYKVTSQSLPLANKEFYEPQKAKVIIKKHAKDYLRARRKQLDQLINVSGIEPILVAPFDAELFGHWWFEGPQFLAEIFSQSKNEGIAFTRLIDQLSNSPNIQLCEPSPSSWGQGGYHNYWSNDSNSWIIPEWNKASSAFIKKCSSTVSNSTEMKLLEQAGRELLLAQSSDWSFIIRAGTTTQLAKDRINLHLQRFWSLYKLIDGFESISTEDLKKIEEEDSLFPSIMTSDWIKNHY